MVLCRQTYNKKVESCIGTGRRLEEQGEMPMEMAQCIYKSATQLQTCEKYVPKAPEGMEYQREILTRADIEVTEEVTNFMKSYEQ